MTGDDLDWLLKVRAVVARTGEMDVAQWWNTSGQLSQRGAFVFSRGLPRTHHFAQLRATMFAASSRCSEVFPAAKRVTLWSLTPSIEEAFNERWDLWGDVASDWAPFFDRVAGMTAPDLSANLAAVDLIDQTLVRKATRLSKCAEGRSVAIRDSFDGSRNAVALLALGFGLGGIGELVVPYAEAAP
ncbi:BrxE family protein [Candidatus Viadribacter manganicus]|uniref:BrxE family protein n=1 Tax=Candidatus Viadribacter manganicus TaxID=1759059 RepID=A0A1B1AHQ3_9PROT|nr:BrxE family protein [Candidatus Viadribacter manganicus]ANP46085.1 hypothetical protein ATE48_09200 [Candidatus Viadribacter manganicus]